MISYIWKGYLFGKLRAAFRSIANKMTEIVDPALPKNDIPFNALHVVSSSSKSGMEFSKTDGAKRPMTMRTSHAIITVRR